VAKQWKSAFSLTSVYHLRFEREKQKTDRERDRQTYKGERGREREERGKNREKESQRKRVSEIQRKRE
jgi:hypothetical protein